jgi:uncharacterized membrane protein affecting hemolysin expression
VPVVNRLGYTDALRRVPSRLPHTFVIGLPLPMLKTFPLPLVHWRRLPPVFYLSVGALLGLLLTAFVLGGRAAQKNAELLGDYGSALAQLSARELADASIGHDLVSMHAIMQDVQSQPRVLMAAVHDLEQSLLVQAGQMPAPGTRTVEFSAPIPLHDSISGHATITLDAEFPGESAVYWALFGTAVLLLIMAGLALYDTWDYAWVLRSVPLALPARVESETETTVAFDEPEPETSFDPDDESQTALLIHSDLVLAIPNRARLEQQLNGDRFAELSQQFDTTLDAVLALYGGVRVGAPTTAGIYCIRFTSGESPSEAAFRALCCAHLIYALNQRQRIRFQVVAEVCHPDCDVKLAVTDSGIFIQSLLLDELLDARIETTLVDAERFCLSGFKPPFASLLERQQEQLLAG